ncbi:hypothetical protein V1264_021934 [Littorina saxatilis]
MQSALLILALTTSVQTKKLKADHKETQISNDICEYDIDLKRNTLRAKCQGQPLGVNVYASNAQVMSPSPQQGADTGTDGRGGSSPGHSYNAWSGVPPTSFASESHLNITASLAAMRQGLGVHKSAISNISTLLSRGDNDLRSDLQALRGLAPNDAAVRESIIATMRNQYNFMRTAILAHNAELSQVLGLLDSLLTLTSNWLETAHQSQQKLLQEVAHINRTMLAMRTTFSNSIRRRHRKKGSSRKDHCPNAVSAIGGGKPLSVPWEQGVVMTDAAHASDRTWVMKVDEETDQLLQYDSHVDIQYGLVSRYFSLPFYCEGTGHVVYRNALFCHKAGTRTVAKYNLKKMAIAAEVELSSAGVANTYPYQFGLKSDIDLAVDEQGLWVIYSTEDSAGKIVISKLNPHSLVLEKTWLTSFPKKFVGNTFMVCGVLYATNSFKDTPTFVRYTYDTSSLQGAIHDAGHIIFNNAVMFNSSQQASSIMLDYNPKEHRLYSWSNAQIQTFPVYFKRKE